MEASAKVETGGERIVARYMPRASRPEHEGAVQSLHRLARLIVRVNERMARERKLSIRHDAVQAVES